MIKVSLLLTMLLFLSGCFGAELFTIGPFTVKPGDIATKSLGIGKKLREKALDKGE